ncbi:MAG: fatty acid desaturase, partial [Ferrovibrio sp.]
NTRTTYANPLARLLLAPYWVNYHLEHHLLLSLPCWKLPAAHRLLLTKGLRDQMEVQESYLDVLRMAASGAGDSGGESGGAKPAHI